MFQNKKTVLDKVINLVLNIVLVIFGILLVISIYNNIQTHILGNSYSSFFGYSTFEVKTGSMEKTISAGDWIIVKASKDIKLDDIITYEKDNEFITHRVIEAYNGTYITKGDANNTKDDPVTSEQIVGKVISILPGFGIVRNILLNPLVLIAIIITLWLISSVLKGRKKIKFNFKKPKEKVEETSNITSTDQEPTIEQIMIDSEKEDNEEIEDIDYEEIAAEDAGEDLEKTLYFRMISVDKLDIDEKALNLDEKSSKKESKKDNKKPKEDKEEKKPGKKFKNIVEKIMFLKKDELITIIETLNNHNELKTNEKVIRDDLLNTYLNAKYYSKEESEKGSRNTLTKNNSIIKEKGNKLINSYKGSDKLYEQKVNKYISILCIVNYLELTYPLITKQTEKREAYYSKLKKSLKIDLLDSELKQIVNDIIKIQKEYKNLIEESIKGQDSNIFKIELTRLAPKTNLYQANLDHNIEFSSIYSDYIVNKTYSEGKIAEEKTIILTNLILTKIALNLLESGSNNKYFVQLPSSMYEKNNKLVKVLNMLKDDYVKDNVIILINYNDLNKNKKLIKSLRKDGYEFAIVIDDSDNIKDLKLLALCNYIFASKNNIKNLNSLPEDVKQNIIETGGK